MRIRRSACVIVALCLTACAQPSRTAQADWAHGAKRAWVVDAVDPVLYRDALPSCIQALPPDVLAARHFVKVRFWRGRRSFIEVAEAPAGMTLRAGDEVEFWPEVCAQGSPARIARTLAVIAR
jgi:hypothetical protein